MSWADDLLVSVGAISVCAVVIGLAVQQVRAPTYSRPDPAGGCRFHRWRIARDTGAFRYVDCERCDARRVYRVAAYGQPVDLGWLETGEWSPMNPPPPPFVTPIRGAKA